jgi:hypothetical protein
MDLNARPFDIELELFSQLFGEPLADEAERSDVIRKDPYSYSHDRSSAETSLRRARREGKGKGTEEQRDAQKARSPGDAEKGKP